MTITSESLRKEAEDRDAREQRSIPVTDAMVKAGCEAALSFCELENDEIDPTDGLVIKAIYRAMIRATPKG